MKFGDILDLCIKVFFFWMAMGMAVLVLFGYTGLYDSFLGNAIVRLVNTFLPIVGDAWIRSKHYAYIEFYLSLFLLLIPIIFLSFFRCIKNADKFFYYLFYGGKVRRNIVIIIVLLIFSAMAMYSIFFAQAPNLEDKVSSGFKSVMHKEKFGFSFFVTGFICVFCQLFATSIYIIVNRSIFKGED